MNTRIDDELSISQTPFSIVPDVVELVEDGENIVVTINSMLKMSFPASLLRFDIISFLFLRPGKGDYIMQCSYPRPPLPPTTYAFSCVLLETK